jgi:hypothetical protein
MIRYGFWDQIMAVNTLATDDMDQYRADQVDRLPPLTAGLAIFGLSLLCWLPLLLPALVLLHR